MIAGERIVLSGLWIDALYLSEQSHERTVVPSIGAYIPRVIPGQRSGKTVTRSWVSEDHAEGLTGFAEHHASSSAAFSTIMEEFIDYGFGRDQDHGRVSGASRSKEGKS